MRRFIVLFAAFSLSSCVVQSTDDMQDTATREESVSSSYIGNAVLNSLRDQYPQEEDILWSDRWDTRMDDGWLQQIPGANTWGKSTLPAAPPCTGSNCDPDFRLRTCSSNADCGNSACVTLRATVAHEGMPAKRLCVGHSDTVLDSLYDTIVSARTFVDVTSLTAPDDRFLAMLRNATTRLSEKTSPPTTRYLFATFPGGYLDIDKTLKQLTRDVRNRFPVYVGSHWTGSTSWNHTKMVVADGQRMVAGGMNLWTSHYLNANPVHDMNLVLQGGAAYQASRFADELWQSPCRTEGVASLLSSEPSCPPTFASRVASPNLTFNRRVITVGRLGKRGRNPSDVAQIALIDSARTSIKISQQDLAPIRRAGITLGAWPYAVFDALIRAAARGVSVDIVLSNKGAYGGTTKSLTNSYYNGFSADEVWNVILRRALAYPPGGADPTVALCKNLRLMYFRSSSAATWPDGTPQANHVKAIQIDDKAFYVGSQNIYVSNLAEFGMIVDNPIAAKQMHSQYWAPLLKYSSPTTVRDARCE